MSTLRFKGSTMGRLSDNAVSLLGGLLNQLEAVWWPADLSSFLPTLMKARKIESAAIAAGATGQLINLVFSVWFLVCPRVLQDKGEPPRDP